jgi:2'-hydroxyisoflavone reductase
MPVVVPETPTNVAFSRRDVRKAIAAGLTFRPLAVTAKDTIDWNKTRPKEELDALEQGKTIGITAAREAELLKLWKQRQAASSGSTQKP